MWQSQSYPAPEQSIAYDLVTSPISERLRDLLTREAARLLLLHVSDRDAVTQFAGEEAEALADDLSSLQIAPPPARVHNHLHLVRSCNRLRHFAEMPKGRPEAFLQVLDASWRDLRAASSNPTSTLIDLSQCCGGLHAHANMEGPDNALRYYGS